MWPRISSSTCDLHGSSLMCKLYIKALYLSYKRTLTLRCELSSVPLILPLSALASVWRRLKLSLEPDWLKVWMSSLYDNTRDIAVILYIPIVCECTFYKNCGCSLGWQDPWRPHSTKDMLDPPRGMDNLLPSEVIRRFQNKLYYAGWQKCVQKCAERDWLDLIFNIHLVFL